MKIVKKLANGLIEVKTENDFESLYDPGDFLEFDGQDYKVVKKKDQGYLIQ